MSLWNIAIQILSLLIGAIIGFFIRSYLPSYFAEKGKNLATKEDISEITDRVEKVKALYSAQTEDIRSMIAEARLERGEYQREQKACLLKFYDLAIELFYEKLTANFGDFPMDQGQSLADFQSSFYELVSNLLKSYQRIVVYFESSNKLCIEAGNVVNQALGARRVMKRRFGKVKFALIDETQAIGSEDKKRIDNAVKASNEAVAAYSSEMQPVIRETRQSLQSYLTALNEFLRPGEPPRIPQDMFSTDE
jgi:archaellum component FlaC